MQNTKQSLTRWHAGTSCAENVQLFLKLSAALDKALVVSLEHVNNATSRHSRHLAVINVIYTLLSCNNELGNQLAITTN